MRVAIGKRVGYSILLTISLIAAFYGVLSGSGKPGEVRAAYASEAGDIFTATESPSPLPEIKFKDGEGRDLGLADFAGKHVLLNIWATWCPPCREEMPALDSLQKQMGGADFEVIAISIDVYNTNGLNLVKEFYLESDLKNLDVYLDSSGELSSLLKVVGIPTTLLVDPEGREIGRKVGPAEWDSAEIIAQIQRHMQLSKAQGN